MRGPDLGGHEQFVALDSRGAQAVADLALVLIDLRGVDMAIAEPQRLLDQTRAGSSAQLPGAEPDRGDVGAVGLDELHGRILEGSGPHYVAPGARCQHRPQADAFRSAKDPWPRRRTRYRARGRSRQAAPVPVRAACACPAPSCGWSRRERRAGRRIRAGSAARGGAGREPPARIASSGAKPPPARRRRWRERKLPPVPQFDDPSVRFQPQALHGPTPRSSGMCRRCALRLRLTIKVRGSAASPISARTTAWRCRETRRSRPRR